MQGTVYWLANHWKRNWTPFSLFFLYLFKRIWSRWLFLAFIAISQIINFCTNLVKIFLISIKSNLCLHWNILLKDILLSYLIKIWNFVRSFQFESIFQQKALYSGFSFGKYDWKSKLVLVIFAKHQHTHTSAMIRKYEKDTHQERRNSLS